MKISMQKLAILYHFPQKQPDTEVSSLFSTPTARRSISFVGDDDDVAALGASNRPSLCSKVIPL